MLQAAMIEGFRAADYFDAFSHVDKNIRSLMDVVAATATATADAPGSDSESQKTRSSQTANTIQPPCLDNIDGDSEEEATVAFLCSGLPHYEGPVAINYDSLETALDAYLQSTRGACTGSDADADEDDDDEEPVYEEAWVVEHQLQRQLQSPETLGGPARDTGLLAYEGWICFEALEEAARAALQLDSRQWCRIGARTETEYMLYYAIDTGPDTDAEQWAVQIPKPSVAADVFESEMITMAYVLEHSDIHVPQILASEMTSLNSVGVPYAIVSRLAGEPLGRHWHGLSGHEKRRVLDQVADVVVQLSELRLPRIGSLAARDGALVVGPLLDPRRAESGYSADAAVLGPFDTCADYYAALIDASLVALDALDSTAEEEATAAAEHSFDRMELMEYRRMVARFASPLAEFALAPRALDLQHFLVDPATLRISGVVDWTFGSCRPLGSVVQAPPFTFDDTPRWEPVALDMRLRHRRNLVRYRRWFVSGLRKRAWAALGKRRSEQLARLVDRGYWRFKFEHEIAEHVMYSNPWSFRAIWQHVHPDAEFAVWFAQTRPS
ncbi:hypothetical protein LPJ53_001763 [Coemansia erecta]|uniref:Aminoglycoside phosphotransferase domain-containing protein n=1 Tax=Coemansia erecta TaxID=147472 RepID=A0A9W8CRT5_9FUNG|nr:hypothetical protein LPJ53_001763 [Coemansia erecta]